MYEIKSCSSIGKIKILIGKALLYWEIGCCIIFFIMEIFQHQKSIEGFTNWIQCTGSQFL